VGEVREARELRGESDVVKVDKVNPPPALVAEDTIRIIDRMELIGAPSWRIGVISLRQLSSPPSTLQPGTIG